MTDSSFDHGGGPGPFSHRAGPPFGQGREDRPVDVPVGTPTDADDGTRDPVEEAAAVVESDLAQLHTERSELVDTLRRVQADFENYRKRVIREQTTLVERSTERLVEELLPVLDSFDGALAHASASDPDQLPDGLDGLRSHNLVTFPQR